MGQVNLIQAAKALFSFFGVVDIEERKLMSSHHHKDISEVNRLFWYRIYSRNHLFMSSFW